MRRFMRVSLKHPGSPGGKAVGMEFGPGAGSSPRRRTSPGEVLAAAAVRSREFVGIIG